MAYIRGKTTANTFVYMRTGACYMLRMAKESEDGQLYTCLSALVLTAFMVEAYLNHLGKLKHEDWDVIERRKSKKEKLCGFAAAAGVDADLTERPYKSVMILFKFRDSMAHGRTVTEEINLEVSDDASIPASVHWVEWQRFATVETAEELLTDSVAVVRQLHQASGYDGDPFISGGHSSYVLSRAST